MDLSTRYLGFDLPHPFVVGASPLNQRLDTIKRSEDAGAAAIVLHSLFEEQIIHHQTGVDYHIKGHEESFAEATTYFPQAIDFLLGPDQYLEHIQKVKESVDIPVIASLNGTHEGSWVEYANLMQEAGADALELNLYTFPMVEDVSSITVEMQAVGIVNHVKKAVSIPVAVKLSPFYTSLPHLAERMREAGADALVIFNRFYQPDIDIENLEIVPHLQLSDSSELLLRLRWLAVLYKRVELDLAVTGGVHKAEDAVKAVMAGSDCIQMVSALLLHGPEYLKDIRMRFQQWMEENEYHSVSQMKGSMSYLRSPNPEAVERSNYMKILQSWQA